MANIIAHIRPMTFEILQSKKLRTRQASSWLGIYDMSFDEFKKKYKNVWPNHSIQDYSTRSKVTIDALVKSSPESLKHVRNAKIDSVLNEE